MINIYADVIATLSDFIFAQTGQRPKARDWRLGKDTALAVKPQEQCRMQNAECRIGWISNIREKNGWLLIDLSDAFYARACEILREEELPQQREDESYLQNRLRILMRQGRAPCPPDPIVQRALWLAIRCAHRGRLTPEAERAILTMSHHKSGRERIELERRLGGVAEAMLILFSGIRDLESGNQFHNLIPQHRRGGDAEGQQ